MKNVTLILTINVIACAVALLIGEIYLRVNGVQPYARSFPGQYQAKPGEVAWWAQSDPYLGWTSNKKMHQQGFRDEKDFNAVDVNAGKTRIMILGDSFMYGAGVRATIPSLLEMRLKNKYEVFNLAVPGWGIDQMYLAYQQYRDRLRPDIVILAFIDDDVGRVLEAFRISEGLNKPSFALKNGDLVFRTSVDPVELTINKIIGQSVFMSLIMHEIYLVIVARPLVETIFSKMAQETQERNEKFIILRIPTPRNLYGGKEHNAFIRNVTWRLRSFKRMAEALHVEYLEPMEAMTSDPAWIQNLYLNDGHLSEAGSRHLTEYLYNKIFEHPDETEENHQSFGSRTIQEGHRPFLVGPG